MTKRIRELIRQATKHYPATESSGEFSTFDEEKFAELIVKECVIQCEREWIRHGTDSVHNQAIHGCINSIKQHFGVD